MKKTILVILIILLTASCKKLPEFDESNSLIWIGLSQDKKEWRPGIIVQGENHTTSDFSFNVGAQNYLKLIKTLTKSNLKKIGNAPAFIISIDVKGEKYAIDINNHLHGKRILEEIKQTVLKTIQYDSDKAKVNLLFDALKKSQKIKKRLPGSPITDLN